MKTVRVYYAGIPVKNNKAEKRDVLRNFHLGVPSGQSTEVEQADWQYADLAVMQGWVHANSGNAPHLRFRKQIISNQRKIGKHTLAIDSNLFLYRDPNNTNHYLRFSLDDVFPTTGNYFTDTVDPSRWEQIKRDLNIDLKPWKDDGKYILICLQRNGGWSMGNVGVMDWCNSTITKIQSITNKKIIVRAHPGDKRAKEYLKINHPGVRISTNPNILDDFANAYAVITYNSSPGVAAAIEGVPVFVLDPDPRKSQAFEVANTSLTNLNNPKMPNREEWIQKICMSHFNYNDLRSGTAWKIIEKYL